MNIFKAHISMPFFYVAHLIIKSDHFDQKIGFNKIINKTIQIIIISAAFSKLLFLIRY